MVQAENILRKEMSVTATKLKRNPSLLALRQEAVH